MNVDVANDPIQSDYSDSQWDTSVPELLLLRFCGDVCVEGSAGELWQRLFSVDCDVTRDLRNILPTGLIKSLLAITDSLLSSDLQFRKFRLKIGSDRRSIEAQLTANPPDKSVILLRDVTLVTRARTHYEHGTSLVALLSPRELDVLGLVVYGNPNKVIAAKLKISAKTVEKYRSNAMRKIGACHVADLVRLTYPVFADQMHE